MTLVSPTCHTTDKMCSVSGVITTYNRDGATVEKAIQSMLNQTVALTEIVVVDDNVDESAHCKEIKDLCEKYENVKYIKQDGNKGACAARNLGMAQTSGEYIAFLDDDDLWLPKKIEMQLDAFKKNTEKVGLVFCCGTMINLMTGEERDYYNTEYFKERVVFEDLLAHDYVGSTSQPLIRRACFEKVGGFWEKQPARQDYEMWLRISKEFDIIGIPEKLFVHNLHGGDQISKKNKRGHVGYINIYQRYKKDYNVNLPAKECILCLILSTRDSNNLREIGFYFARMLTRIKMKHKHISKFKA